MFSYSHNTHLERTWTCIWSWPAKETTKEIQCKWNWFTCEKHVKKRSVHIFRLRPTCSCSGATTRTELVPASTPPLPQQQHCHRHSVRDERSDGNSQLLHFPPPVSLHTFVFSPSFPPSAFCFKYGRVNFLILQAASLSIYLSSCVFSPISLSRPPSLRQGCAVRPLQSSGVVRSDGWLSTFCCLPLCSWEIYRPADYQAWKPISLSFFSPFLHPCLPRSFHLVRSISISPLLPKKALIMERCVQNNIEICARTEGSNCSSWGLLWMCRRGITSSEWYAWSLTAYLTHLHLHLLYCFQRLRRLATHEHPSSHAPLAGGNYGIRKKILGLLLCQNIFAVMIIQRHFVNAIKTVSLIWLVTTGPLNKVVWFFFAAMSREHEKRKVHSTVCVVNIVFTKGKRKTKWRKH